MTERGEVWWGQAPFKNQGVYRPWLVVSTTTHPFADEECIAVGLTTTDHEEGMSISTEVWLSGEPDVDSYVSPWFVATLKLRTLERKQGRLEDWIVTDVVQRLHEYVPATVSG
jgi:mRNA-degrading endonuclease toxin of MazEF toxin-antitoxin module